MMGFVTFNDEAEQYLCAVVLRPGNVTAAAGAVGILCRIMALIRGSFSKTRIRVCLDGGEALPQLLAGRLPLSGWMQAWRPNPHR